MRLVTPATVHWRCYPRSMLLGQRKGTVQSIQARRHFTRLPALRAPQQNTDSARKFDEIYDVVVVGSGCSGLSAAVVAAHSGLRVLVVEKTNFYGGTTAYSAGGAWTPCNKYQAELGVQDSRSEVEKFLRNTIGDFSSPRMKAFLESAPKMVDWMDQNTALKFQGLAFPDYMPWVDGASVGRTVFTKAFDGRVLGKDIKQIRYTIRGFTGFGSMQADWTDAAKLTAPFSSVSNFTFTIKKLFRFAKDLLQYGKGTEMRGGNALVGSLFKTARDLGVEFWNNSAATTPIMRPDNGGIDGIVIARGESKTEVAIKARRGVVLASGGLGRSAAAQKYVPHEWTAVPRGISGDGISLAEQAGAHLPPPNKDNAIYAPISLLVRPGGDIWRFPHFALDRAKPGSIIVDTNGKRFANESESYQDFVKTMHARGVKRAYFIANKTFLRKYGMGMVLPWPYPNGSLMRNGYLIQGATLDKLARKMDVDATALKATVSRYNQLMRNGHDEDFHRGENAYDLFYGDPAVKPNPCLAPMETGPYYALPLVPGNVSIVWGVTTDRDAQVLDAQEKPIRGLYAVGNDQNSVMQGQYPGGGMCLGPSMTFGYRAGQHIVTSSS